MMMIIFIYFINMKSWVFVYLCCSELLGRWIIHC